MFESLMKGLLSKVPPGRCRLGASSRTGHRVGGAEVPGLGETAVYGGYRKFSRIRRLKSRRHRKKFRRNPKSISRTIIVSIQSSQDDRTVA